MVLNQTYFESQISLQAPWMVMTPVKLARDCTVKGAQKDDTKKSRIAYIKKKRLSEITIFPIQQIYLV